ncbi:MAG: magnesium transporter [Candidatus Promineifilaceae bacterium]
MQPTHLDTVLAQLRETLERDDVAAAAAIIEALRPADQADVFEELADEAQFALLPELKPADSADILEELEDEDAAELVASLPTATLIRIVEEMEPDEAADLLGDLHPSQAAAVLAGLEDPEEVRPLLIHADDSAGGLMTSDFLALRRRMTAAEALAALRAWKPDSETIYDLFVVDRFGRLVGVVNLRRLVLAEPDRMVGELMDGEVISAPAGTDQEEVAQLMTRYDLLALPVVAADGRLLGIITIDDIVDVLEEEITEDFQRLGGALPLERSYLETSVVTITRKRIGWLLLLLVAGTLTASVMRLFQEELEDVVALAVFVPLLIGAGGNAGSQTTSTIIRALAVDDVTWRDGLRVLWHEARAGILMGLGMGLVAYLRAITWDSGASLAAAVAISIGAIIVWATSLGSLLPLIAARLKVDPTVVSGPAMSTLVDATGLFIYFSVARAVLGL